MPRALTLQEKKERAEAKLNEVVQAAPVVRETADRAAPEVARRQRGAFNGTTSKLSVSFTISGYHLHWLNDYAGRITQAVENGYEFVKPEEVGVSDMEKGSERVKRLVGTDDAGNPLFAYLMKIRQDWYDEDQASIQERNDLVDQAIRQGRNGQNTEGFYVPREGISMKVGK